MISTIGFIGPFPPPVHGQSWATESLANELENAGVTLERYNLSTSRSVGWIGVINKLRVHFGAAVFCRRSHRVIYISANSNTGMWLTSFVVARARFLGCKLVIHHHSYDHVLRRRSSMVLLARIAGPNAVHVVLGQKMAADMRLSTPEVGKIIVLNNAGLVEKKLLSLPENSGSKIVLGHLSNLTAEKGISEVVELAIRLREMSLPVRLVIAGPAGDHAARDAISLARRILGEDFNYKGPVHGNDKIRFFSEITHLIFPTRYKNEASPIVLLEAMAAAVPCISNMRGCISNDLGKEGGVVVEDALKFTSCAINYLTTCNLETASSAARNRYITLKHEYDVQFSNLLRILTV